MFFCGFRRMEARKVKRDWDMTLICKSVEQFGLPLESLTQDKRYVAIQEVGTMVLVVDDFGREVWYSMGRFVDEQEVREEKLKKLGIKD